MFSMDICHADAAAAARAAMQQAPDHSSRRGAEAARRVPVQVKTALAETSGSRFLADCERLVREARFDELISLLITHIDLVLSKSSEKGE